MSAPRRDDHDESRTFDLEVLIGELDGLLTAEGAALKLVALGEPAIEPLRRYLLEGRPQAVPGVLRALARLDPPEALPVFARALEDDFARPTAERALRDEGAAARPVLVAAATSIEPDRLEESESSRRRRHAALQLLGFVAIDAASWCRLRVGLRDSDLENLRAGVISRRGGSCEANSFAY